MEILSKEEYAKIYAPAKGVLNEEVTQLLASANALILGQLNWDIKEDSGEFIDIFEGRNKYFINNLTTTKIKSFTNVTSPGSEFADRCHLIGSGRILISPPVPKGTYKITFDAEATEWPEDLKLAVALTVRYWEKQEYRNDKSFGGESISFMSQNTGLPKHIMTIVNMHRIV